MPQNSSARYYQDNKERLQIKACGRYQSLSKKEKEKATIWSWKIEISTGRWKEKTKRQKMRRNAVL